MAKEEKQVKVEEVNVNVEDNGTTYDFGLDNAYKFRKNRRELIKKVMKDAEKTAEDFKKNEDKLVKKYVKESINVKDRKALGNLLVGSKKKGLTNKDWKINRSTNEEFRYVVQYNKLVEGCGKKKIKEAVGDIINRSPYKDIILEHFGYNIALEFYDLVADILDRAELDNITDVDSDEFNDNLWRAVDEGLIYYSDQWQVLEHYCNPQDANWENALDGFTNDINSIAYEIVKGKAGNKEEESLKEEKCEGCEEFDNIQDALYFIGRKTRGAR